MTDTQAVCRRLRPAQIKSLRWTRLFSRSFTMARTSAQLPLLAVLLSCLLRAFAQNITGTVTNGTTGKPSAGDEVTLLSLSQGMQEIGTTKSDAQGHFSFAGAGGHATRRTWCASPMKA